MLLVDMGEQDDAVAELERLLDDTTRSLGRRHVDTLTTLGT